jgi:hypothetical protein
MLDAEPTTRPDVPYGTPAMAGEIERIVVEEEMGDSGIIVMGGHRDGILCFGRSLDEAEALLVERLGATGL